ncbi:MAG: LCP family protein [Anaerolineaceae bacterium]|nr:LCP family protein [Anaerolineaceae bacterium]
MSQMRSPRFRFSLPHDRLTIGLLIAFTILGVATAIVAFVLVRNAVASWTMTNLPGLQVNNDPQKNPSGGALPSGPLQAPAGPTPQPWDGASRVTVLVMGLDYRDWEAGDVPRSDSMWLFTIDPVSKTAGMMSIPRDTWVNIPGGYGYAKINQAYFFGEVDKLPGGGPALAMRTVEDFLGVPVNYYAQIDFNAFVKFIDKLDGIYIDVPEEIKVDPLGPGNTVILQPGRQKVWGAVALGYARNRYAGLGDFDRSKRQLQVIMGIRERVMQPQYLPILIGNAVGVYNLIADGVHTNLTLQQAIQLAWLAQQVGTNNIRQAVIGPNEVIDSTSPDGLSIEIPIPERIRLLRDTVFTTGGPVGPGAVNATGDQSALAKAENAKIAVQNGTATAGLAGRTGDYLKSLGLNITDTSNADKVYGESTVIDYTGKPYTVAYLVNVMHIGANRILNSYDPNAPADVVVIAGNDWANKNEMP